MPDGKRIALVGTAPSGAKAPFHDPSWEIWGVGKRAEYATRVNRWFELHRLDGEDREWAAEWRRLIRTWSDECEIWMFYPEPDLGKKIIQMNPKPLVAKYGAFFMTSSFSWMMAQAIEELLPIVAAGGFAEIGLWGVDMEYGTEYREQRVGLRHFIELARIMGIAVTRVPTSGIAYEPVPYPLWQDDPLLTKIKLRRAIYDEKIKELDALAKHTERAVERSDAVVEFARSLVGKSVDDAFLSNAIDERRKEINQAMIALTNQRNDLAEYRGSIAETTWLLDYLTP